MAHPYGPGVAPGTSNNPGNRLHFPEIGMDGTCGRRVKRQFNGQVERCGQVRAGDLHLYYQCPYCPRELTSIDRRIEHIEGAHPRKAQVDVSHG